MFKVPMATRLVLLAVIGWVHPILAQETFHFQPRSVATPDSPVVDIYVLAAFNPDDFAFASATFAIEAHDGQFVGYECLYGPCGSPPLFDGRFLRNIVEGQLHFPPAGIIGDDSNPFPVSLARWQPDSFEPRDVHIQSISTTRFFVYLHRETSLSQDRIDTFTEGSGVIRVRRCATDCDGDDVLTIFDFLCFMNAFVTGDPYADFDGDGELTILDFLAFQNAFVQGCG
ncbi:MAG: hypothetical protein KIT54_09470 [Phycisphaeraceae bacterium]|nr:hypothetical protein [Phycisphaeraceae bacterium]